jgi:HAD superfamily hydrolase (TIGR01509 family)
MHDPRTKGVILDFDGTMGLSLPHWAGAYRDALAEHGQHHELPDIINMWFHRSTSEVLNDLSLSDPEGFKESVWERVRARMTEVEPYPGLLETLHTFRGSAIRTGVATNSRIGHVSIPLKQWGILDSFHAVVAIEHVPRGKPHPDPILKALELMEVEPRNAIMFGDSPVDIQAGHAAGVTTVAFSPEENHAFCPPLHIEATKPGHIVRSYRELHDLVLSL